MTKFMDNYFHEVEAHEGRCPLDKNGGPMWMVSKSDKNKDLSGVLVLRCLTQRLKAFLLKMFCMKFEFK